MKKRILYEEESRLIFNAKCHEIKNQEFQTKLKCEQEYFSLLIFRTKGIMIFFQVKTNQKAVQMRVFSYELKGIPYFSPQINFRLVRWQFVHKVDYILQLSRRSIQHLRQRSISTSRVITLYVGVI